MDALVPLVLVLKQFLYQRGLHNAFTGGLSSYCLVLMVISFLQLFGGSSGGGTAAGNSLNVSSGATSNDKAGTSSSTSSHPKPALHNGNACGTSSTKNLGVLLHDFLELYGKRFDYQNFGITVCHGG